MTELILRGPMRGSRKCVIGSNTDTCPNINNNKAGIQIGINNNNNESVQMENENTSQWSNHSLSEGQSQTSNKGGQQ